MAFRYRPASSLESLEVNEQRAIIEHKAGMQRMFISITLGKPGAAEDAYQPAVWIFPVPGGPDRADVEVTDFVPELEGRDLRRAFKRAMNKVFLIPMASQPHLFPFLAYPFGPMRSMAGVLVGTPGGVTTHKTADRWGVHAALITADSVERLGEYLQQKNVKATRDVLSPFVPYLSDKYALVAAWISSYDDLIKKFPHYNEMQGDRRPSLYVEFPTHKPFYPMRPTSGYGKTPVRVSLYFVGLLKPDTATWTASEKKAMHPDVDYHIGTKQSLERRYRAFLAARKKDAAATDVKTTDGQRKAVDSFLAAVPDGKVPLTRVVIRAPAENFTQDLFFSPNSQAYIMHAIATSRWVFVSLGILLLAVLSYVSGGIGGALLFGEWKRWARIGLWNCLTIAALVAGAWLAGRDPDPGGDKATTSRRREAGAFGAFVLAPLLILLSNFFSYRYPIQCSQILSTPVFMLLVVELALAAWIVSRPGLFRADGRQINGRVRWVLAPRGIRESFIRVTLMCTSAVVLIVALRVLLLMAEIPGGFLFAHVSIPVWVLILLPIVTAVALFVVSWLLGKNVSTEPAGNRIDPEGTIETSTDRKSVALILGALASIVAMVLAVSIVDSHGMSYHEAVLRITCFGSITGLLLAACWIVGQGASAPSSTNVRVSLLSVAIPGLLVLVPVSGILAYNVAILGSVPDPVSSILTHVGAILFGGGLVWLRPGDVSISGGNLIPVIVLWGMVAVVTFLKRKHIGRFLDGMPYSDALSYLFVILGVFSYFGVLQQFFSALVRSARLGDSLVVFALLSGTWLVKRELKGKLTKALRFGVAFSVFFALLNLAAFVGIKALLAFTGILESVNPTEFDMSWM